MLDSGEYIKEPGGCWMEDSQSEERVKKVFFQVVLKRVEDVVPMYRKPAKVALPKRA